MSRGKKRVQEIGQMLESIGIETYTVEKTKSNHLLIRCKNKKFYTSSTTACERSLKNLKSTIKHTLHMIG